MSLHLLQNPCTKVYTASNIIALPKLRYPTKKLVLRWTASRVIGKLTERYGESTASRNLLHVWWIFHISVFWRTISKIISVLYVFQMFSISMNHPISYCGISLTNRCSSLDDSRFTASITLSQTIRSCSPCICMYLPEIMSFWYKSVEGPGAGDHPIYHHRNLL